jgi:hypothetical protein
MQLFMCYVDQWNAFVLLDDPSKADAPYCTYELKKKTNMTWKLNQTHPDLGKDSQQPGNHGEEEATVKFQIKQFKKCHFVFQLGWGGCLS